mmetsp:Transcript_4010/g.10163  ORF Transcript_4010/g.10163 Transcript_4010/m.10163 type:complete len:601 (+) Transcript_4010:125-1927(+)
MTAVAMDVDTDGNQFRPLGNDDDIQHQPPRSISIDDYLDSVYHQNSAARQRKGVILDMIQHWRYYIIFIALGIANSGDSAEMGCTNYILSSVKFQHDILGGGAADDEGEEVDFAKRGAAVAGAHFAGMLISGLLSGVLADIWGRRSTLLLGLACNAVVGVLSAAARTATELCLLRFACGVNLGMVIAGVVTLSAEISPPSKRGRFMTLVASCYTLGFLYTAFWALIIFRVSGSGNWRLFMFMNALPTIVAASLVAMFAPESPRFFLCRGKLTEAVSASNLIASRIGYVDKLLTEEELRRYLFQAKRMGEASFRGKEKIIAVNKNAVAREGGLLREVLTSLAGIKQVFVNGYWRTTIPLQLSYFSLTLVSGVATWLTKIFQNLDLQTDAYALSFYQTLSQIPGVIIASGLIDLVGRRQLVIIGFGSGSATLILLAATANKIKYSEGGGGGYALIVLALACVYTISLCVAWLAVECLSAESFPTKVRSTGRGVCVATGRLAGFCVQFWYGPLVNQNRLSFMMGLASLFSMGGVAASYLTTDTTNVDLQDHWDYSSSARVGGEGCASISADEDNGLVEHERQATMRTSFAETTHSKYLSVEPN